MKCPSCGDEIYSMHRHDFVTCSCDECFIDGGRDYIRVGYTSREPERVFKRLAVAQEAARA